MKTVVIGDIHGRSVWKLIVNIENPDRVIFIGDYFDSFDISGVEQMYNFNEIIDYKNTSGKEVIMLIGNHDYHYFPEIGSQGYSGYQSGIAPSINQIINENRKHLQMSYQFDEFLFSHAGVCSDFMDAAVGKDEWDVSNISEKLNDLFLYKPRSFAFGEYVRPLKMSYVDPYGDNIGQSPIWIRPRSLKSGNYETLRKKVIQVVGHTQVDRVDTKGGSTGGRYYFIDCLGTSGQYMVINDGEISFGTWKPQNK